MNRSTWTKSNFFGIVVKFRVFCHWRRSLVDHCGLQWSSSGCSWWTSPDKVIQLDTLQRLSAMLFWPEGLTQTLWFAIHNGPIPANSKEGSQQSDDRPIDLWGEIFFLISKLISLFLSAMEPGASLNSSILINIIDILPKLALHFRAIRWPTQSARWSVEWANWIERRTSFAELNLDAIKFGQLISRIVFGRLRDHNP